MVMIARMWRGWVRTEQADAYVAYITGTGLREYAATPGNLGCQMWTRDLRDRRTEVLTVSWWESRAAIVGFAGSDIEAAVFYPEDDEYLVDRETTVSHMAIWTTVMGLLALWQVFHQQPPTLEQINQIFEQTTTIVHQTINMPPPTP